MFIRILFLLLPFPIFADGGYLSSADISGLLTIGSMIVGIILYGIVKLMVSDTKYNANKIFFVSYLCYFGWLFWVIS